ncbi:MAG: hypothetical protein ACU84H_06275 [Gammaproteobacteria bacterium]
MSIPIKHRINLGIALSTVIYVLADTLLDLLMELLHMSIEMVEFIFDSLIEHVFHTDRHTTQTITFYLMLLIAAFFLQQLIRRLPDWFDAFKLHLTDDWRCLNVFAQNYWQDASILKRAKWLTALTIGAGILMWGLLA